MEAQLQAAAALHALHLPAKHGDIADPAEDPVREEAAEKSLEPVDRRPCAAPGLRVLHFPFLSGFPFSRSRDSIPVPVKRSWTMGQLSPSQAACFT